MPRSLIANPPYNMAWEKPPLAGFMRKFRGFPIPPAKNANYAFILTALDKIDRKAALLLPNSVLSPVGDEKVILQKLIEQNVVSAVVTLPNNMFESTSIPVCVLVLEKGRTTRRVEMVDLKNSDALTQEVREQRGQFGGASHTGRVYKKTVNVLSPELITAIVDAIKDGKYEPGFAVSVEPETIAAEGYNLTPARYLEREHEEPKHRPFEDIAADYNRIIDFKNRIHITLNETAAKRLGFDCIKTDAVDLSESFQCVGQTCKKEDFISFTKSDGITIKASTKDGVPDLILDFLNVWRHFLMHWNNEENRLLAEFRDALLPELMSGKIF